MAQSRLEKIGTIYSRTKSLIRGGAMKTEDLPLWYPIYEAFPPKQEPRYNRETPNIPIRPIFYKEDVVRAEFQKDHRKLISSNLANADSMSSTQKFLEIYKNMEKSGTPQKELYSSALEAYRAQSESFRSFAKKTSEDKNTGNNDDRETKALHVDLKDVFEK